MTSLAIVITTYNRSAVLRRLLLSLESQTDLDFQVVVANDGSTDDTESMMRALELPFEVLYVNTHCEGYGLAVARNIGILVATREAVVILDDDSFPEPAFVAAHKNSVREGVVTGGPRRPADLDNHRMRWKMQELGRLPPLAPMTIDQLRRDWPNAYLVENNICMLRKDFIGMGLFSERLKMYGFIGQEFFGRAEFLGIRYQYNQDAAVVHHGEIAGDNGFLPSRKERQTRLASLLRPTLMTRRHYRAQVAWAAARAQGIKEPQLPPFLFRAALALPARLLRDTAARARRRLRTAIRGT